MKRHVEMEKYAVSPVRLDEDSTTVDVVGYISAARNDDEISEIVREIDRQGKLIFGRGFSLRFDKLIFSKDFRRRVFIKIPGFCIGGHR